MTQRREFFEWTEKHDSLIAQNYNGLTDYAISKLILKECGVKVTAGQVEHRAKKLGINRTSKESVLWLLAISKMKPTGNLTKRCRHE